MSRLINLYNNLEYFEEQETTTEDTSKNQNESTNSDTQSEGDDTEGKEINVGKGKGKSNIELVDSEGTVDSEETVDNEGAIDRKSTKNNNLDIDIDPAELELREKLKALASEDIRSMDFDEQDDDELEEDNIESQADAMLEEDEMDDDDLTDDDINTLMNSKFLDNEKDDEIDDEVFIPPVIDLSKRDLDPNLDEKLSDMGIDDDDTDENLFKQGGAAGERTEALVGGIPDDGDELAQLIMEVPIEIIKALMKIVMDTVVAAVIGPIAIGLQDVLEPVRTVLGKLYSIVTPIVLLINNFSNIPLSIGSLVWSTMCNMMKLFGVSMKCKKKYKEYNYIKDIYDSVTDIDILKPADIIFNDQVQAKFFAGVSNFVRIVIDACMLTVKTIPVVLKTIELIINGIKETMIIMTQVTDGENLKNLIIIIIMMSIGYILLFGLTHSINNVRSIIEKFGLEKYFS